MKPTINTPSTVILGAYLAGQRAAVVGSLRDESGALRTGVLERSGDAWRAIAQALGDAEVIGAAHIVILTNEPLIVAALSKPFPAPVGGEHRRVWTGVRGDGQYIDIDLGDCPHWQVLHLLGWGWAGAFAVQLVGELPAAKALWEATHATNH
jgi:hypothetical protein